MSEAPLAPGEAVVEVFASKDIVPQIAAGCDVAPAARLKAAIDPFGSIGQFWSLSYGEGTVSFLRYHRVAQHPTRPRTYVAAGGTGRQGA